MRRKSSEPPLQAFVPQDGPNRASLRMMAEADGERTQSEKNVSDFGIEFRLAREIDYAAQGILVGGVDEAGRGPLAGPVVAACCVLDIDRARAGLGSLRDSKKLTALARERLEPEIIKACVAYGVGWANVVEIASHNILGATFLAMRRAVEACVPQPQLLLVDGNAVIRGVTIPQQPIVGGDDACLCIAAASVLAKVARDREMALLDAQYPHYGFAKHKGYGTAQHVQALRTHGACPEHRRGFLDRILPPEG